MSTLPPEMSEWAERRNIRQTRRGIAEAAGVGTSTISRLLDQGNTSWETVAKVAAALNVDPDDIFRVSGISEGGRTPWQPPLRESFMLSTEARDALDALVRLIAQQQEKIDDAKKISEGAGGGTAEADPAPDLKRRRRGRTVAPPDPEGEQDTSLDLGSEAGSRNSGPKA